MRSLKAYVRKTILAIGTMEAVFTGNGKRNDLFAFSFSIFLGLFYFVYILYLQIFVVQLYHLFYN